MVNKIFKLRNTTLSLCGLNTVVAIVTSSLAELYGNRILTDVTTRQSVLQGVNVDYALQVRGQELSSECLGVRGD